MPFTIKGIGTRYYGKRNVRKEMGTCQNCRKFVQLENYDIGLYFVILYIPIIPLGRRQITDKCFYCLHHRVMPLAKWRDLKSSAIETSLQALVNDMHNPARAFEYLFTLTRFNEMDDARELAATIEAQYPDNADAHYVLAGWHMSTGMSKEVKRLFQRAFELNPDNPDYRRTQAMMLVEQGRLDEARELVRCLEPPAEGFQPEEFVALGEAFQKQGNHVAATEMFRIAKTDPTVCQDKKFLKMSKRSEKRAAQYAPRDFTLPRGGFPQQASGSIRSFTQ